MPGVFACECVRDQGTGRIIKKVEKSGSFYREYDYGYDDAGRLTDVFCNDLLSEQYVYNAAGQRIRRLNGWADGMIRYGYDKRGCCLVAGNRFYEYDEEGTLCLVRTPAGEMRFQYENTLLRGAVLPDGTKVTYAYNGKGKNPVCPVAKYVNGELAVEYVWRDIRFLDSCVDHGSGIQYDFFHDGGKLVAVRLGDIYGAKRLFLQARCDQVGTPKLFTTGDGRHIKELAYDSFGVLEDDTNPDLLIPIGFAGGLVDEDTGLVRFGFRDYDPFMGRFTCPDPLGDTGGDHDLYDYCVDDPINLNDPSGLLEAELNEHAISKQSSLRSKQDEYGWLRKNIFWWTLPHTHPEYRKKRAAMMDYMDEQTLKMGAGWLEIDQHINPWSYVLPGSSNEEWRKRKDEIEDARNHRRKANEAEYEAAVRAGQP